MPRSLMQPDQPGAPSTGTAVGALAAYAAVCVAVIATVMASRGVTAWHGHLNLDSSRPMWLEARGLRDVLDHMLRKAQAGDAAECKTLVDLARDARQNLEISFRVRLGYQGHQERRPLGQYDKVVKRRPTADA